MPKSIPLRTVPPPPPVETLHPPRFTLPSGTTGPPTPIQSTVCTVPCLVPLTIASVQMSTLPPNPRSNQMRTHSSIGTMAAPSVKAKQVVKASNGVSKDKSKAQMHRRSRTGQCCCIPTTHLHDLTRLSLLVTGMD